MASIVNRHLKPLWFKIEEADGHRQHGRVYFHHVHPSPLAGEIHRHNANSQTDAEHIVDVGGICASQSREHVSEMRDALFPFSVVGVLGQVIVKVITEIALASIENLELSKMGIAVEQFDDPL